MTVRINRRDFLKNAAIASMAGSTAAAQSSSRVSLVMDRSEAPPAHWAAAELVRACYDRGIYVAAYESLGEVPANDFVMVADTGRGRVPDAPESMALVPASQGGRPILAVSGSDTRGLVYALLDLADRVEQSERPIDALRIQEPVVEQPANSVRSVARLFTSGVEDNPWFRDLQMWPAYFRMLATHRFNRFNLSLGIGYDFLREVTDAYFLFAYPFFVTVPTYNVRAVGLSDGERDQNLEMLQFISEKAAQCGLQFQLGLWTHGYEWVNSPHANYTIEGLTPQNHASYCRDALAVLLRACPAITGVTFRIHGESGVAEGNYSFWRTVFDAVNRSGRRVEIDLHSKGIDEKMIETGLSAGVPLKVSPKFWAEHMGMPYHQADIREQERPRPGYEGQGLMALSTGARSFTRYGYADLLRDDRRYTVMHRIWPGTQRLLLGADPASAAAYSRAFGFCGSAGVEIMEPLSFKGRRGSGIDGGRCAYADASLNPHWDWQKYLCTYRVWGRAMYNPQTVADATRRYLRRQFGAAAPDLEAALASAGRILPIVTTAHGPSAANNTYWPEMYTNQPVVDARKNNPYTDTPAPKVFGNVSPFDPQLFSTINGFADEMRKGEFSGKYSPLEVAQWLQNFSESAAASTTKLESKAPRTPDGRRFVADLKIQAGLGLFFAEKFRAGVQYALGNHPEALKSYRRARDAWAQLAAAAKKVYAADITFGEHPWLRGHWQDRLAAIDDDIADMAAQPDGEAPAFPAVTRPSIACRHAAPSRFTPGSPLDLEIATDRDVSARLLYRHVNQAERWQTAEMRGANRTYRASIPAAYTAGHYPLQYYFELRVDPRQAALFPGFDASLLNQPYFICEAHRVGRAILPAAAF